MKKILLLSLLVLFGCSKDSSEDEAKLFYDKVGGKVYVRADLLQRYEDGIIDFIGVFHKFPEGRAYQYAGYNSASKDCYKTYAYTSYTATNETSNSIEGVGELTLNRGTEIFTATTNFDGSEVTIGTTREKLVLYEDYYEMVNIWKSNATGNSCLNLGF